jgi:mRNA-degrading endonuclease RelE of RelBE toxin-antitoxin system
MGLHAARRGEYRVIYEIRDAEHEVRVLRVQHRP